MTQQRDEASWAELLHLLRVFVALRLSRLSWFIQRHLRLRRTAHLIAWLAGVAVPADPFGDWFVETRWAGLDVCSDDALEVAYRSPIEVVPSMVGDVASATALVTCTRSSAERAGRKIAAHFADAYPDAQLLDILIEDGTEPA